MASATFQDIRKQISSRQLQPVYLLHGEEGYYLDVLAKEFETILTEEEREFDQRILYAPQIEPGRVMDICRGYPMISDRQVVILKEAQAVRADQINRLHKYCLNPSPTTVFVIIFRGEKAKGADLIAAAKSKCVIFESQRVPDYRIPPLISSYITEKGMTVDPKAQSMLHDFIGSDLSRLYNEIDKLATILGKGAKITPEAVERNIGVSKDFNNFELVDALARRDAAAALRIANYFKANPKNNPLVVTTATLYNFFSDLLVAWYSPDRTEQGLMKHLNLKSSFQVKRFVTGMRSYNARQVIEIIWALRRFDTQSKGSGSRQNEHELFHDLIYHILTAPGNLFPPK